LSEKPSSDLHTFPSGVGIDYALGASNCHADFRSKMEVSPRAPSGRGKIMPRTAPNGLAMSDHANQIVELYQRHAAAWAADRAALPWTDKPWHDRFIAALPPGGSVLDLGCGSGAPIARDLVARGFRVTGIDSAPDMIAMCRNRLPTETWQVTRQVTWQVADMRTLQLGARFDGILAWDSYFHLSHDDQRRTFAVFAWHAAPAAVLMFNTGPAHGEALGSYGGEPLYHASLAPAEYRDLLDGAGFEVVAHIANDAQAGGRTGWLARRLPPTSRLTE
jgi:SAM-dependent methyltransferase